MICDECDKIYIECRCWIFPEAISPILFNLPTHKEILDRQVKDEFDY